MKIYLLYFIAFISLFYGKIDKNKTSIFLSKETTILKGGGALLVILHHIQESALPQARNSLGAVGVGIFFILSAYGLLKSAEKSNFNYLKRLFFVKIPTLYFTNVLVNTIYYLVFRPEISTKRTLAHIFGLDIFRNRIPGLNDFSWYIITILFIYLMFGITLLLLKIFKINKNKKLFICLVWPLLILSLYIFRNLSLIHPLYVRSLICFVLGILLFYFEKQLIELTQNKIIYFVTLALSFLMCIISQLFLSAETYIPLFAGILFILVLRYVSVENNKLFLFLGKISLEFFLFQRLVFMKVAMSSSFVFYSFSIIGTTIIVAILANYTRRYVKKFSQFLIKKIKRQSSK